jgi:uncharacterized membrane protein
MLPPEEEKGIRTIFHISIILKGLHAVLEIIGGTLLFFITTDLVVFVVKIFTLAELTEDPSDFIANYLRQSAEAFTIGGKTFAALYLLSHGIVKLFLVVALLKNKLWAYPASFFVFGAFIVYQLYRFTHTHSWVLIALSVFDAVVLWLIWHEYTIVKSADAA